MPNAIPKERVKKWTVFRYCLIIVGPLVASAFYLHWAGMLMPIQSPESFQLPGVGIEPRYLVGFTVFGRNQNGLVVVSDGLNKRIAAEIENNEKLLEKVFFPFLWYRFDLQNNLRIASTSPVQISPANLDLKCTPTDGKSVDVPTGQSGSFISRLTDINELKYGCVISNVHGEEWSELKQDDELLIDFEGDMKLSITPYGMSQGLVSLLFYFLVAIPAAVLIKKSLSEAGNFVRGSRG